jgi:hypothetical protein
MKHNEKERHLRGGGVHAEKLFGDDDVGGARYRQEFGKALNNRQDNNGGDDRHVAIIGAYLFEGKTSPPFSPNTSTPVGKGGRVEGWKDGEGGRMGRLEAAYAAGGGA